MKKQEFCIIGADDFCVEIARNLQSFGVKVVILDQEREKIDALANEFEYVYRTNAINKIGLQDLSISEFETVIVGVSTMEDSILIIKNLVDLGVKKIIAKVRNEVQKNVLLALASRDAKIEILWPEEILGNTIAFRLFHNININLMNSDNQLSIVNLPVYNSELFGISISNFDLKSKYLVNIICIKRGDEVIFPIRSYTTLKENDVITVACENNCLETITRLFTKIKHEGKQALKKAMVSDVETQEEAENSDVTKD